MRQYLKELLSFNLQNCKIGMIYYLISSILGLIIPTRWSTIVGGDETFKQVATGLKALARFEHPVTTLTVLAGMIIAIPLTVSGTGLVLRRLGSKVFSRSNSYSIGLKRNAPGHWIVRIARFAYPNRIYEAIFRSLVADLREEHADALMQGHWRHAKWIVFRGWLHFGLTVVSHAFSTIAKLFIKIWKLTP